MIIEENLQTVEIEGDTLILRFTKAYPILKLAPSIFFIMFCFFALRVNSGLFGILILGLIFPYLIWLIFTAFHAKDRWIELKKNGDYVNISFGKGFSKKEGIKHNFDIRDSKLFYFTGTLYLMPKNKKFGEKRPFISLTPYEDKDMTKLDIRYMVYSKYRFWDTLKHEAISDFLNLPIYEYKLLSKEEYIRYQKKD